MANFLSSKRFETKTASLRVDAGLSVGQHTFQLTVVDTNGNKSKAVKLKVIVVPRGIVIGSKSVTPFSPFLTWPFCRR